MRGGEAGGQYTATVPLVPGELQVLHALSQVRFFVFSYVLSFQGTKLTGLKKTITVCVQVGRSATLQRYVSLVELHLN